VDRWYWQAKQHIRGLFPELEPTEQSAIATRFVEKYDGTRLTGRRSKSYQRTTDAKVSPTDPDASPMSRFNGDRPKLGYHTHYVVDGGKARIILAALTTPASIMDNTPMLDLARWVRFRWQIKPDIAVGDTRYGTIPNIVGLEQDGIRAYLPTPDLSQRTPFYPIERFHYDAQEDTFICPQGQPLKRQARLISKQLIRYRADAQICAACPVRAECTTSKVGRSVHRSFFQELLNRAETYHQTEDFKKALRKRQVWVEPLFGEAKQWHQGRHFRLRRLRKVNIEGLLRATGQNIKRLLKQNSRKYTPDPATPVALSAWRSFSNSLFAHQ
jgi:hypothetical protein